MAYTIENLKKGIDELNKKLGLDPQITYTSESKKGELEDAIKECAGMIEKGDKISKDLTAVLEEMGCLPESLKEKPAKAKKQATEKGPGVISTIADLINEKGPITKDKILKELTKRFPDRDPDAMIKTINVQLPNRMSRERGMNIVMTEDGYVNKKKK